MIDSDCSALGAERARQEPSRNKGRPQAFLRLG